ncbi:MAG: hypothetical protein IKR48_06395 [Kiritimatiellae bacterium]|nr:hypothetical protein [Kiritimatiellia bacterium]
MNRNGWFVCVTLLAVRMVCLADYVELTATDGGGQSSFNTGLHWQNGISPTDETSTNVDFLVRNGKQIRTPDNMSGASYTFGGKSLTLGDPDNPSSRGELSFKTCNPFGQNYFGRVRVDDLRLYAGVIYVGTGNTYVYLDGTTTVFSKRTAPFEFNMAKNDHRMMNLSAQLVGDADVGICTLNGTNYVRGANGSTYAGNFTVQGSGATMKIDNRANLGIMPAATFDAEAIILDGGSLHLTGSAGNFAATDNKGLMVTSNGGKIFNEMTCNFNWPISGNGTLRKIGHESFTMRFGSAMNIPAIVIDSGRTALATGFSMPSTSTLTLNGGRFQTAAADVEVTVYNFTYNGGEIMLIASGTDSHVSCIHFQGSYTQNGKIPLSIENIPTLAENESNLLPVLTIPVAAKVVTADDFEIGTQQYSLPLEGIVVTTDNETGIQTVSVRVTPYVMGKANPSLFTTPGNWSNGKAVQAGYDYFVQGRDVRHGGEGASYVFPGTSLTLYNPSGWTNNVKSFVAKHGTLTFADLRMFDYTGFSMGGGYSQTPILNGQITVRTTDPGYIRLHGGASRTGTINATIRGEGHIKCTGDGCTYKLTADNSAFMGKVTVRCEDDYGNIITNNTTTLRISDETNLGTAPVTFAADALTISDNGIFRPLSSLTLDDATRGITFKGKSKITTDTGVTLTTQVPLAFAANAQSTKDGAGTWVLDGTATAGRAAALTVQAGAITVQNAEALKGVALTFAADAAMTLAVPSDQTDERWTYGLLANGGLTAEGETLDVMFTFDTPPKGSFSIPLCTVPEADADALAAKLSLTEAISGYSVEFDQSSVQWNGATYTCFVARFRDTSGTVISIR